MWLNIHWITLVPLIVALLLQLVFENFSNHPTLLRHPLQLIWVILLQLLLKQISVTVTTKKSEKLNTYLFFFCSKCAVRLENVSLSTQSVLIFFFHFSWSLKTAKKIWKIKSKKLPPRLLLSTLQVGLTFPSPMNSNPPPPPSIETLK